MKKILILFFLIIISSTLISCSSENKEDIKKSSTKKEIKKDSTEKKSEKTKKKKKSSKKPIINVEEYSLISKKQLQKMMGEPQEKEEWMYNSSIPLTTWSYKSHKFEFIFYEDQLIRLNINSEKYNTLKGKNFPYRSDDEALRLIGLTSDDVSFSKVTDTGLAKRYTEVNSKIYDVWFYGIRNNEVETIKITFASGIFN